MRVLMYGWEFPPHISGGLGVACYGIVKALSSRHIPVTMILPQAIMGNTELENVRVLGCNFLTDEFKAVTLSQQQSLLALDNLKILNPYFSVRRDLLRKSWFSIPSTGESSQYGADLFMHVYRYAMIAGSLAKKIEHDVIHAHDWLTILAGIEAKRQSGKPLLFHVHALEQDRSGDFLNQEIVDIEKVGLTQADHIVAVSQYTKNRIMQFYGIPAQKITVAYNGIDEETLLESSAAALPKISTPKIILFVGRVTGQKGPAFFLEIARRILTKRKDVRFIIAGTGDLLPSLIEQVAAAKLGRYIHCLGFVEPALVIQLYQMADVYVMTSVSEPFGLSCLEAVARQVPVIISKQSGVTEVMEHVLKADFWDTQEMAAKILTLLEKPILQKMLTQNAYRALKQITWQHTADQLIRLYQRLIAGRAT